MKTGSIPSQWIRNEGTRLDAGPFLSGAFRARAILAKLANRSEPLASLTSGVDGGIYNGPQFRRVYVTSTADGVRFLTSSAMLLADLSELPLLSKVDAHSPKLSYLQLIPGSTLISCSGTIGRTAFVRRDMADIWSSQDIIKVVPNPQRIRAGYLNAFLSSDFCQSLLTSRTYGAIIPHLEPEHVADLPVPRLGESVEKRIDDLVSSAATYRANAAELLDRVNQMMPEMLGFEPLVHSDVSAKSVSNVMASDLALRLDAPYHSQAAIEVESQLDRSQHPVEFLSSVVARYFKPPMFKRLWVDGPAYGTQFISGNDAYRSRAEENRYVSRRTPAFDEFILERGWVVFQGAGQIYGLFGKPLFVWGWLEGLFCADDVYRLVPKNENDGAYLFAFLRTAYGQVLLKRQACGNSIPRVWDPHMRRVRLPWPKASLRNKVAEQVIAAHEARRLARNAEDSAIRMVDSALEGHK